MLLSLQVTVEGHITTTGLCYVPTEAYVWVNVTTVKFDQSSATTAIANDPTGNVADTNGSDKNVSGHG